MAVLTAEISVPTLPRVGEEFDFDLDTKLDTFRKKLTVRNVSWTPTAKLNVFKPTLQLEEVDWNDKEGELGLIEDEILRFRFQVHNSSQESVKFAIEAILDD